MRCVLTLAVFAGTIEAASPPRTDAGELSGAPFTVALPAQWNGSILLLAPGYRAAERPRTVDFPAGSPFVRRLLDEGWIVAKTAYRRNGIVLADALSDLDALRDHLAREKGEPRRVIVEGEGMGGLVAVLLAEREPESNRGTAARYSGVIALAPALHLREANSTLGLSLQPRVPAILLCPRSQLEAARQYAIAKVPRPRDLRPLLLSVERDGSAAINEAERLAALLALQDWLDQGRPEGPPARDVTRHPEARPSQVVRSGGNHAFFAHVKSVAVETGNFALDAQPADFAASGIGSRSWFGLEAKGGTWRVLLGRDFAQVRRGEWLAFADGEGWIWLGRHGADAAAAADVQVGDLVTIRAFGETGGEAAPKP